MKKAAPKKSSKENKIISKVVSEIIEEEKPEIPDGEGKEKLIDVPEESEEKAENEAVDVNSEEPEKKEEFAEAQEEAIEEETRRYSFYEKVMGEKPPEKHEEPEETKKERSINAKLFLLGASVFVLTVLVASLVGFAILNKDVLVTKLGQKTEVTPTQVPPTPTPIAFVRSEWSFEVLNGSSTPGLALKASEKIKALGYEVSKVGNSDDTVETTQVLISSDATDADKDFILEDLKKDFGNLSIADTLSESKKTVRIILAK